NYSCSSRQPAETGVTKPRKLLFPGKRHTAFLPGAIQLTTAANAIMEVRFHQQSTSGSEFTAAILDQKLSYIFTAANRLHMYVGCRSNFLAQALPHPFRSSIHVGVVCMLTAQGCSCLLQSIFGIQGVICFVLHRVCLFSP